RPGVAVREIAAPAHRRALGVAADDLLVAVIVGTLRPGLLGRGLGAVAVVARAIGEDADARRPGVALPVALFQEVRVVSCRIEEQADAEEPGPLARERAVLVVAALVHED